MRRARVCNIIAYTKCQYLRRLVFLCCQAFIFLALTGCASSRLKYAIQQLEYVMVEPIGDSIPEFELYHALWRLMQRRHSNDYKYIVQVAIINEDITPTAINQESVITRQTISQKIVMTLYDTNMRLLNTQSFRQICSYNSLLSPYGTYTAQEKMSHDLIEASAQEIRSRLLYFFAKRDEHPL